MPLGRVCLDGGSSRQVLQLQMDVRNGADAVQALHIERFSADADAATLETTEAFIDLRTLGSHAASRTTTRLSKIADGPSGMHVFAARQADGLVQIVVTGAQPPPSPPGIASSVDNPRFLSANVADASTAPVDQKHTDCGYAHFTLSAGGNAGQMAEVLAQPLPAPVARDPDDESDPNVQAARRGRAVRVVVSLSQVSSEPTPLLSVSFGVVP
jgi:hypothetical protein